MWVVCAGLVGYAGELLYARVDGSLLMKSMVCIFDVLIGRLAECFEERVCGCEEKWQCRVYRLSDDRMLQRG